MAPFVYLWHAALGALCLLTVATSGSLRVWALRMVAAAGVAGAVTVVLLPGSSLAWRSAGDPSALTVAAFAVAAAWALLLVADRPRLEPAIGGLVGACGTALLLAAANQWLVPGLLFWACSSLALGALGLSIPVRGSIWVALFASDVALFAALVVAARAADSWRMPTALEGWALYALLGAGALRAGAVPLLGPWRLLGEGASPGIPLLTGGGAVLIAAFSGGSGAPSLGIVLVLFSIVAALDGMGRGSIAAFCAAPVLLLAGLGAAVPAVAAAAGVAAVLVVTATALWPCAGGAARFGRALMFSSAPLTLSFQVLSAAAASAFARSETAPDVLASIPWAVQSALLPVALAGAVLVAALVARYEPERRRPGAAVLTWVLAGISLVLGSYPGAVTWAAGGSFEAPGREVLLAGAAIVLAAVAGLTLGRRPQAGAIVEEVPLVLPGMPGDRRTGLALTWSSALLWVATVVTVVWITVLGLRAGFL